MSDQDDEFPPEVEIPPERFKFRELTKFSAQAFTNKPSWNSTRCSCLAVANKFGIIFVGVPTGVEIFHCHGLFESKNDDELMKHKVTSIALRKQPTWITVSTDNLTLSICCCSDEGIQILFFDTRNILNKSKSVKTPLHQSYLSKSGKDAISSLSWNPVKELADLLALTVSNGKLYVISVKDNSPKIVHSREMDACTVCWRRNGKSLLVGKRDGSLCRLSQDKYEVERSISASSVIGNDVEACDLLWLSDEEIASIYTTSDTHSNPTLFVTKLSPNQDPSQETWTNYDEPSAGWNDTRQTQIYLELIEEWNFFIYVSSNSSDVATLAKDESKGIWEIWSLDDSSRAFLPISKYSEDDTSALGVAIITGHSSISQNTRPVLALLSDDCVISLFEIVNATSGIPSVVQQIEMPNLDEERVPNRVTDLKGDNTASGPSQQASQKKKLTAKPSVYTTGKLPSFPSEGPAVRPKVPLGKIGEDISPPVTTNPMPSLRPSIPTVIKPSETKPKASMLSNQFSIPTAKRQLPPTYVKQPQPKVPEKVIPKSRIGPLSEIKGKTDVKSTVREIAEFEKELDDFQSTLEETEQTLNSLLGNPKPQDLTTLPQFHKEIDSLTKELGGEVHDLSAEIMSLLSSASHIGQKMSMLSEDFYRDMMQNRPLSHHQRQKLSALENLFNYVVTSTREADALLDDRWENRRNTSTLQQKRGKKAKLREWESARQALIYNMKISHDLQTKILNTSQLIDRLRLTSRIAWKDMSSSFSLFSRSKLGDSPRSSTKETSLLNLSNSSKMSSTNRDVPEKRLSAIKQHKLGKALANRDNRRVVHSDYGKTSILRNALNAKVKESKIGVTPVQSATPETEVSEEPSSTSVTESEPETPTDTPDDNGSLFFVPVTVSMMKQGSATLAYGAPSFMSNIPKMATKQLSLSGNEESKMNLNHPPRVVNIKEVSQPAFVPPKLPTMFEPKADVPAGAAQVMQSVFETVKAETSQPIPKEWSYIKENDAVIQESKEPVRNSPVTFTLAGSNMRKTDAEEKSSSPSPAPFSLPGLTSSKSKAEDKPQMPSSASSSGLSGFSLSKNKSDEKLVSHSPAPSETLGSILAKSRTEEKPQAPSPAPFPFSGSFMSKSTGDGHQQAPSPFGGAFTIKSKPEEQQSSSPAPFSLSGSSIPKSVIADQPQAPSPTSFGVFGSITGNSKTDEKSNSSSPTPHGLMGFASTQTISNDKPLTTTFSLATSNTNVKQTEDNQPTNSPTITSTSSTSAPGATGEGFSSLGLNLQSSVGAGLSRAESTPSPLFSSTPLVKKDLSLTREKKSSPALVSTASSPPPVSVPASQSVSTATTMAATSPLTTSVPQAVSSTGATIATSLPAITASQTISSSTTPVATSPPLLSSEPRMVEQSPQVTTTSQIQQPPGTSENVANPPLEGNVSTPAPASDPSPSHATTPSIVDPISSNVDSSVDLPSTGLSSTVDPLTQQQDASNMPFGMSTMLSEQKQEDNMQPGSGFGMVSSESPAPAASTGISGFGGLSFGTQPASGPPKNPFGNPFAQQPSEPNKSVFGQVSQPFGGSSGSPFGASSKSVFGSSTTTQEPTNVFGASQSQNNNSSFTSPGDGSVASKGFGAFGKSSGSAFGAPAQFGSAPSFGSSPAFGSALRTFGSGFGSSTSGFGMNTASSDASNGGFASFAKSESTGFGNLANQSGSTGFGSLANQNQSSGFGGFGNQGGGMGFGALSQNSGASSGFGTFGNQNNSVFGNVGSSSPFGGMQSNQPSGGNPFGGTKPEQTSSFTGWR